MAIFSFLLSKCQAAVYPPSTGRTAPVMPLASDDARNTTAAATSSRSARRPIGIESSSRWRKDVGSACDATQTSIISVDVIRGATRQHDEGPLGCRVDGLSRDCDEAQA